MTWIKPGHFFDLMSNKLANLFGTCLVTEDSSGTVCAPEMSEKQMEIPTAHSPQTLVCDGSRMTIRANAWLGFAVSEQLSKSPYNIPLLFIPEFHRRDCSTPNSAEISLGEDKGLKSSEFIGIPLFQG